MNELEDLFTIEETGSSLWLYIFGVEDLTLDSRFSLSSRSRSRLASLEGLCGMGAESSRIPCELELNFSSKCENLSLVLG